MGKIISIETENLVTFTEAAQILKITRPTIYKRIKDGQLHPLHIGRNQYFVRAEIEGLHKKPDLTKAAETKQKTLLARALQIATENMNGTDTLVER